MLGKRVVKKLEGSKLGQILHADWFLHSVTSHLHPPINPFINLYPLLLITSTTYAMWSSIAPKCPIECQFTCLCVIANHFKASFTCIILCDNASF